MRHLVDQNRRDFLKFMGLFVSSVSLSTLNGCTHSSILKPPFSPVSPTRKDDLVLAEGFISQILIKQNDPINKKEFFGSHNDYLHFLPINQSPTHGLLWVNHEYLHPVLFHNREMNSPRTKQEIYKEQLSVGASILEIHQQNNEWKVISNSPFNRRITGRTQIPFQKGYQILGSTEAVGTVANCAGGKTPWNTILTCEENYEMFYGDVLYRDKKRVFIEESQLQWYKYFPFPPEHYGWVVEVNPWTGQAIKRVSLGRFSHEAATVCKAQSGQVVIYMGEDQRGGFIYKFISDSSSSIETGTLYAANTASGEWIPLDLKKTPVLKKYFNSQIDVLTYAHYAAEYAGATPQDRPEDIEIIPNTNSILIALTNNPNTQNLYGSFLKLTESKNDFASMSFQTETWVSGGPKNGFACPDNMAFDNKGNLWFTVDMAEYDIGTENFHSLGNNGLFYMPLKGENAGRSFQVASAPTDAEFTGPHFSPDYKTLFLSVQHPGSQTKNPRTPTSTWPERKGQLPKSSVVTIYGPQLENLTS